MSTSYNETERRIVTELISMSTLELIDEGTRVANEGNILRARLVDQEIETRKGEP